MGKKDKKKGKGAEKTALKTEKKALSKIKKELVAKGEDDLEKLIAAHQEKGKKYQTSTLELCTQPSPRSGFSFCPHPDKDELILFGGEYFNGKETVMYNELYFYNIKKHRWNILKCPVAPPPRCSHQAIVVSQNGGQMWIFGGEFASPSRSSFYHYKDLWVLHFSNMNWEQVKAPGGPSPRSGHRMVVSRKQIVVFGGFHESIGDYRYFNDVHLFDFETYKWSKLENHGKVPFPRSGCQMAALSDGRILLYGGYSRAKIKKEVDKGMTHGDMYHLHLDEKKDGVKKCKWTLLKPGGLPPSSRCGLSIAVANNYTYFFGGVLDTQEEDELLSGVFHNDLYRLEMNKGCWTPITLLGKGDKAEKRRRRKVIDDEDEIEEDIAVGLEHTTLADEPDFETTYDDSIFTVKIGPNMTQPLDSSACSASSSSISKAFLPNPRMNAGMVVKNGMIYLYGGMYEDGDRQITLSDFYCLDIHKLDEWQTIIPFSTNKVEWIDSEESDSGEDEENMDDDDDDDEDDSDEEDDMEMG